jgi:hypothetical protein
MLILLHRCFAQGVQSNCEEPGSGRSDDRLGCELTIDSELASGTKTHLNLVCIIASSTCLLCDGQLVLSRHSLTFFSLRF